LVQGEETLWGKDDTGRAKRKWLWELEKDLNRKVVVLLNMYNNSVQELARTVVMYQAKEKASEMDSHSAGSSSSGEKLAEKVANKLV